MIFTELRFIGFFLLVFALHWSLPWRRGRHVLLLVASYTFYAAWDVRFLALILFSTTVDFCAGLLLDRTEKVPQRKAVVALSLVVNLGLLGVFKYFNFFADSFVGLMRTMGVSATHPTLHLILPVGISFYTFQSISYTVDIYRRKLPPERDPLTFATFVAFFPQLVAGPIMRAVNFLPQMKTLRRLDEIAFRPLLLLFLWGFIKKAVVSDNLAPYVDTFFAEPGAFAASAHWLGVLMYAAQIYCDFSGYTDMAIATAGLLGYRLCLNFDHPYIATSPRDFWRRWHISLSTWLRDYLYIPLGGGRAGPVRVAVNLMVTMLLGGLWHGAAWTFVVWGALHGVALVGEHLAEASRPRAWLEMGGTPLPRLIGWALTTLLVLVGWVFFRAPDFSTALTVLRGMVGDRAGAVALPGVLWWYLAMCFGIHVWGSRKTTSAAPLLTLSWPRFSFGYGILTGLALLFVNTAYRPFIYFHF